MSEWDKNELLKRSLLIVKKLEEENRLLKQNLEEPIAIVGMACRLPGNVNSPEEFWELLIQNKDAIIEIPPNRWDVQAYYDPDKDAPGKMYTKKGGFLQTPIDEFDAEFFHISPREAEDMDPQQRIALEVAWETIENAGINPKDLKNSLTGVYMGVCGNDYSHLITKSGHAEAVDKYYCTGNHYSIVSGRIAFFFGFHGPAISMDTACSSSVVALDAAVKDLRLKYCNAALVGGVNIIMAPEVSVNFCKSGMLSPEGQCKTFDASANGYVRSDACAFILVKRLSDALADHNTILAIIRGTAVNQDGPSSGLTVPNGLAQEQVIQKALEHAKLSPSEISYIEAHGTGTALGDPIELEALKNTYGKNREKTHPAFVGSVKTNIGHTETASGIVSVMKVVLSLLHEKIPAILHFKKLNPSVDISQVPLEIANKNIDWKRGKRRIAGINSFGFSGTNVHLLIEEGPELSEIKLKEWKERSFHRHEFNRQRYWAEAAIPQLGRHLDSVHPLLGEKYTIFNGEIIYRGDLQLGRLPYLNDHQVYDQVIYPAAAYFEMMLAASVNVLGETKIWLKNVDIEVVLSFDERKSVETQVLMTPNQAGYEIDIYSKAVDASTENAAWHCHARGMIAVLSSQKTPTALDIAGIKLRCPRLITKSDFYSYVNSTGIHYGEHFQALNNLYVGEKEALGELKLPYSEKNYLAHPALLDGALQLLVATLWNENSKELFLPIACDVFEFYAPLGESLFAYWQEKDKTETSRSGDLTLCTPSGKVVAQLSGMQYRKTTEQALKQMLAHRRSVEGWIYEWDWSEKTLESTNIPNPLGHWLILSDGEISQTLKKLFENNGATCQLLSTENHPKSKADFLELLGKEHFNGILHISSLKDRGPLTGESIRNAQLLCTKSVLDLSQALVQLEKTLKIPLILITQNIESKNISQSPLLGLFKTIILEQPELSIKLFDVASNADPSFLFLSFFDSSAECFFSVRGSRIFVPRFLKALDAKLKRHELTRPFDDQFRLISTQKGLLENLTLSALKLKGKLDPHEVEVEVRAVGLNFRDVLDALGLYPGDPGPLGGDGAGIILQVGEAVHHLKPGEAVLGMMSGSLARKTRVHQDNIILKPETLSFAEASALPTVFLTVYYAFKHCAELKKGDSVLIHAGAGGVGQAAIQLAKYFGASIIVTAGSERKREFLQSQGIKHIFDSRSLSFGRDIENLTEGEGVDVVLNSLSGEGFIETSVRICKKGARFLEIGKRDIWPKEKMQTHRPDIDYHIIALDEISQSQPELIQTMLTELMPLFQENILKSLPITVFPIEEAVKAFDYMRTAKHTGKVVIEIPPLPSIQHKINANASYLITGGLGGLGLTLAKWLLENGATHLILSGRKPLDDENKAALKLIEIENTHIDYVSMDIGDEEAVKNCLKGLEASEKPLKGIFHLAGIIDDATLMEQSWPRFEKVFQAKVYGSFYLHQYSKNLDLFVMFSSMASSLGNPGQSNYAAANAFMDALCEYRHEQGLPAHSLSWGPWSDVGMAKELVSSHERSGMLGLKPKDGMRALEFVLLRQQAHVTIANIHWKNYLKKMVEVPTWLEDFVIEKNTKNNLFTQLEALPIEERLPMIKTYFKEQLRLVLGLSAAQILDEQKGFFDMGLDSLMAVELKNRLQADLGKSVVLNTNVIFNYPSVESMVEYLAQLLKLEIPIKENVEELDNSIDEMSIEEIRQQLKSEDT